MIRSFLVALAASFMLTGPSVAQGPKIEFKVTAGKDDAKNVPVTVPLEIAPAQAKATHIRLKKAGSNETVIGQWTSPSILTAGIALKDKAMVRRDLHFILPEIKAGTTWTFTVEPLDVSAAGKEFHFQDAKGNYMDLLRGEQPVFRYVYRAYDNSSKAEHDKTYKVFHHLFEPGGKRIVTNGGESDPGSEGKKLLYPHHRGLMFAFNKITYGNGTAADTWHAKPMDTHESHAGFLSADTGLVLGRHRVAITWHGPKDDVFANEEREMTVYGLDGGTLVEFATRLRTADGKVRLDGDPQHAGFQFRAANAVTDTAKQTYYLRPDGKGKPGETRNWDPKTKGPPNTINLPWDVMSFVLFGQRFSVAYLDHPNNPGEKRYSERDYGRFGCYFEYDLTPEHPLVLNDRVWLQNGEMTGDQVWALRKNFVAPPTVSQIK